MKLATSYFGNRIPRHVHTDMRALGELGFDRVVHTFCENDLAFYPDTLRAIVDASHACGLEVLLDPWGVARVFGGEAFSRWILEDDDLRQRGPSGHLLAGACLNHPRLRERLREWIEAAAATGAEGIFWDEPHWVPPGPGNPQGEFCACRHCLEIGGDLQHAPHTAVESFRADSVVRLLADLTRYSNECGLSSSICLLPPGMNAQPHVPWEPIAKLPGVTELGTDPYWCAFNITDPTERDHFIDATSIAALDACRGAGIRCMLWLQAFRIGRAQEAELFEGARRVLAHRPDTIAIWGFEACAHMSALSCERPDRVWRGLIDLVRHPGQGQCDTDATASRST